MRKEGIQNSQLIRRLKVIPFFCVLVFSILAGRVVIVSLFSTPHDGSMLEAPPAVAAVRPPQELVLPSIKRATITDRNGQPLAISLPVAQLYANPRGIYSPPEVAKILKKTLPALDLKETRDRLSQPRQFVYLARNLTLEEEKKSIISASPAFILKPAKSAGTRWDMLRRIFWEAWILTTAASQALKNILTAGCGLIRTPCGCPLT